MVAVQGKGSCPSARAKVDGRFAELNPHTDLAVHGDHYDYWDYTGHFVEIDGNHLHYWRNVTHDYNYTSSCGGGGCTNPPCPKRVEAIVPASLVAL